MELFGADAPPGASGGPQPVGFVHLCFTVDDIAAKERELNEAGVATEGIIDCSDDFPGLKVCFFNDPEGNRVELMEGWQDQASPPPPRA
jgi:glyoxylase I family protein